MSDETTQSAPAAPRRAGRPPMTEAQRLAKKQERDAAASAPVAPARPLPAPRETTPAEDDDNLADHVDALVPDEFKGMAGWELLGEACLVFGIDPESEAKELLSWKHYTGAVVNRVKQPDAVRLVTFGGTLLSYPLDEATERKLADLFKLHRIDKVTGQAYTDPLPADLALPREAITGVSEKVSHRYEAGYLRRAETPEDRARHAARQRATGNR